MNTTPSQGRVLSKSRLDKEEDKHNEQIYEDDQRKTNQL